MLLLVAVSAFSQTPKQWRDSLSVLNGLLQYDPKSVSLHLRKAAVNLQLLEWETAIEECTTVLQEDKKNLAALYYRAYANNSLRRYELARNDYEDFLKISPYNMEANLGLAYTYTCLKHNDEALDLLNNLVEMYPDSSVVYVARGELEKDMKSYDIALYDFDKALEITPYRHDIVVSMVEVLIALNRRKEAKDFLDEAVRNGIPKGILREWYTKCGY